MLTRILSKLATGQLFRPSRGASFCTNSQDKPSKYLTDLEVTSLESQPNELKDMIKNEIEFAGGEMKMARYWQLALTHPTLGYYSSRNAFSKKGDFTTSPQISPLFGQILGVWIVHFLQSKLNKKYTGKALNAPFRLLEAGGGRGLLMSDMLRVLDNFQAVPQCISMIETSEMQSREQQKRVLEWFEKKQMYFKFSYELQNKEIFVGENNELQLQWFKSLEDMMMHDHQTIRETKEEERKKPLPLVCVTNEFFDALPTTPLVYTQSGWREKIVTINEGGELAFGISKYPTQQKLAPATQPEVGSVVEINYEGLMFMQSLAQLIEKNDGAILTVDYGNDFTHSDSIRAIRDHKYIEPPRWLNLPGMCDLSAYVDFLALKSYVEKVPGMVATSVMPQGLFLESMGIHARAQIICSTANPEKKERVISECNRLTHPDEMGEIYKIQLATSKENIDVYPFIDFDATDNVF